MPERSSWIYLGAWLMLMLLLAGNIGLTLMAPEAFPPLIHELLAALQALLIIAVFMSLGSSGTAVRFAAAAGFFWLLPWFWLTFGEYRGRTLDVASGRLATAPPPSIKALAHYLPDTQKHVHHAPARSGAAPESAPVRESSRSGGQRQGDAELAKGERVYHGTCIACHASGNLGAPKVGDTAAWQARVSKGISVLTSHALNGFGAMPAKGGNTALSPQQVGQAIRYMLRESGILLNPADGR